MCGIAGIVTRDGRPVDPALLRRMTDALAHRGPDGEGFHVDGGVGLGHRRLAIIDLVTGAQPMASADGAAWLTYNGEVYNYRELRDELVARGFAFRTTSDTEVILRAYEAWGVDCVRRLRGMFAFAIWDGARRRLLLARDRAGIKPLVYAWDGSTLRFGSEPKAILADDRVARDLDPAAVALYFTHLYVPGAASIFTAIRKLPPASCLVWDVDRGAPAVHRYWDLRMAPDTTVSERDWIERLQAELDETVRLHMVSDVPVGAFLSGGIDSSAVVASMARASSRPVRTFAIGFDEADFDELAYARLVAQRYGTEHVEMVVKPDVMEILPRITWQLDEPFGDASMLPTYCVSRITRDHVTVALSGDGGDESFAGYRRYADALGLHARLDRTALAAAKPLLRVAAGLVPDGVRGRGTAEMLAMDGLDRYHRMMTFQTHASLARLLSPDVRPTEPALVGSREFRRLAAASGSDDYVAQLQYVDIHHYLPDDILVKVDRASMLVSLESRVPLLDHVLMELAATIPTPLKLAGGEGKRIFKRALADRLPADVLGRRKMGFGVPLGRWFRNELGSFAREVLTDTRTRQRGVVRPEAALALLDAHQRGGRDLSATIWGLISFELWARQWWDR